jgi:hypothetical protein
MSIAFDTMPPRAPRRSASAPTASLLNRIQKPPLVERLSRDDSTIKAPSGPYVHSFFPPFDFLFNLFFFSLLDVLLQEDQSVTDLLVVVVVPIPSRVHPKVLKNQRPPKSSIKNWMHLWETLMLFPRAMLLPQLLEMLIWFEQSSPFLPVFIDYMFTVNKLFC